MKTVIFNTAVGSSNRGDDIIFNSAEEFLVDVLDYGYTMYFGTHVKNISLFHLNSPKVKFAKEADYKFILGTNLLTANVWRTMGQWQIGIWDRCIYKNSILMGAGTKVSNKEMTAGTRRMYEQILRKDIAHSVRDEESKEFLSAIKGLHVINTGCPTLWKLTQDVCERIPVNKSPNVIITVSGQKKHRKPEKDQILLDCAEKNYDRVYLWVQTAEDESYFNTLKHKKDIKKIYSFRNYQEVCKNGEVDYIGTRLHGGIYAMQCGVRTLIIEIDNRAAGIRETNNINTIKRNDLSVERLEGIIHGVLKTEIHLRDVEIKEWLSQFAVRNRR